MDLTSLLLWGFIAAVVIWFFTPKRSYAEERSRVVENTAEKIRHQMDSVYGGAHQFSVVDLSDYPRLDRDFYDGVGEHVEAEGFSALGEVEDLTVSATFPAMRTCLRVWTGDGGTICATAYHVRPAGWMGLLQLIGLIPRRLFITELVSESVSGEYLSTNTTEGVDHMSYPESVRLERHLRTMPIAELLYRHRERLQDAADFEPRRFHTLADAIASMERASALVSQHRQGGDLLDREEMESMQKRPLKGFEEEVLEAVNRD